jgi:hypothetical protein
VHELLKEYEVDGATDSKEANINRFMYFCGVAYQVVSEITLILSEALTLDEPRCLRRRMLEVGCIGSVRTYGSARIGILARLCLITPSPSLYT